MTFLTIPWFQATPWEIPIPGFGTLPIQPFGVLVAIGVLIATRVAERFGERRGVAAGVTADLVAHILIASFIAAPILNTVFYDPDKLMRMLNGGKLEYPGLSSYGGFIGTAIGIYIWKRRRKLPLLPIIDNVALAFPFGWFFGRLGCFVVHDHPGKPSEFFLAVANYKVGAPPFIARHDLGLYEVLWSAGIAALLLWFSKKKRNHGFYVAWVCLTYAPIRFFLDFLREDETTGGDVRYAGLTPGQWLSIVLFLFAAWMLKYFLSAPQTELPEHATVEFAKAAAEAAEKSETSATADDADDAPESDDPDDD